MFYVTDASIEGVPSYTMKGAVIAILSWFAMDPQLAVHEDMLRHLPNIANIVLQYNGQSDGNEEVHKLLNQSYDILYCAAKNPLGVDVMVKQNIVKTLCYAAGAFKAG